jgi:hypothetical protein
MVRRRISPFAAFPLRSASHCSNTRAKVTPGRSLSRDRASGSNLDPVSDRQGTSCRLSGLCIVADTVGTITASALGRSPLIHPEAKTSSR